MTPHFQHDITASTDNDRAQLLGYTKCLKDVLQFIEEQTEFKPEKRFIDSLPLLEKIIATNRYHESLLAEIQAGLPMTGKQNKFLVKDISGRGFSCTLTENELIDRFNLDSPHDDDIKEGFLNWLEHCEVGHQYLPEFVVESYTRIE